MNVKCTLAFSDEGKPLRRCMVSTMNGCGISAIEIAAIFTFLCIVKRRIEEGVVHLRQLSSRARSHNQTVDVRDEQGRFARTFDAVAHRLFEGTRPGVGRARRGPSRARPERLHQSIRAAARSGCSTGCSLTPPTGSMDRSWSRIPGNGAWPKRPHCWPPTLHAQNINSWVDVGVGQKHGQPVERDVWADWKA